MLIFSSLTSLARVSWLMVPLGDGTERALLIRLALLCSDFREESSFVLDGYNVLTLLDFGLHEFRPDENQGLIICRYCISKPMSQIMNDIVSPHLAE